MLCPESGVVLARFSSRAEAERYIIDRELENARRAVHAARRVIAGCFPLPFLGDVRIRIA